MAYVTAGAHDRDGNRFSSKKALKEAIKAAPSEVIFDRTDTAFNTNVPLDICADSIPEGVTVQVAGPDPYTSRRWFASVKPDLKVS